MQNISGSFWPYWKRDTSPSALSARPTQWLIGWSVRCFFFMSVGWFVCHNFLKWREVSIQCSYRSTCSKLILHLEVGQRIANRKYQCHSVFLQISCITFLCTLLGKRLRKLLLEIKNADTPNETINPLQKIIFCIVCACACVD